MRNFVDASWTVREPERLRGLLRRDGYLFFRCLLEPRHVRAVGTEVAAVLARLGWIDEKSLQALGPPRHYRDQSFGEGYKAVQSMESFHRLAFEPALWNVMRDLFGEDVFVHPSKVARIVFPATSADEQFHVRPHQDFSVMLVTAEVLTAWIPLVSCPPTRGGLLVLPGSQRSGFRLPDVSAPGHKPFYLQIAGEDDWATTDFQPGDVLVFHSLLVHASAGNITDQLRLSVDFRYQPVSEPIRSALLEPHGFPRTPGWDVLCRGWRSRRWVDPPDGVEIVEGVGVPQDSAGFAGVTVQRSRFLDPVKSASR